MKCDACIRPMRPLNNMEVVCVEFGEHSTHYGHLRNYARPGSVTVLKWFDDDRRTFHGDWPGDCPTCILPLGHAGNHA